MTFEEFMKSLSLEQRRYFYEHYWIENILRKAYDAGIENERERNNNEAWEKSTYD